MSEDDLQSAIRELLDRKLRGEVVPQFEVTRTPPVGQCMFCGNTVEYGKPLADPDEGFIYSAICDFDKFLVDDRIPLDQLDDDERAWCESQRTNPSYRIFKAITDKAAVELENTLLYGLRGKPN